MYKKRKQERELRKQTFKGNCLSQHLSCSRWTSRGSSGLLCRPSAFHPSGQDLCD